VKHSEELPHGHAGGHAKDESLDIEITKSRAYRTMPWDTKIVVYNWLLFIFMGVAVGFIAFIMDVIEELLIENRWEAA